MRREQWIELEQLAGLLGQLGGRPPGLGNGFRHSCLQLRVVGGNGDVIETARKGCLHFRVGLQAVGLPGGEQALRVFAGLDGEAGQQLPGAGDIGSALNEWNQHRFRLRVLLRLNEMRGDIERGVLIHRLNFRLFADIAYMGRLKQFSLTKRTLFRTLSQRSK